MKRFLLLLFCLILSNCCNTTTSQSAKITGKERKVEGYRWFGTFGDDVYELARKNLITNIKVVEKDNICFFGTRTTIYGD